MHALKLVLKVILILAGSVMLAGGGLCAASNVFFAVPNLGRDISIFVVLFGISVAVAAVGWLLLELAGVGWVRKSRNRNKSTPTANDSAEQ